MSEDASTTRKKSLRAPCRPPAAHPIFEPHASRVSWYPLAELVNEAGAFLGRSDYHSGRPSREHAPYLFIGGLRRQGAATGLVTILVAEDARRVGERPSSRHTT